MIRPVYRFAAFVAIAGFLVSPAATASAATIKFDLNGVAPVVHTEQHSNAATVPTIELDFDNMTFRGGETLAPPATVGHIRLVTLSVRTPPCTPNGLTGHNYPGDRRQRVLYSALPRIGARYDSDRNNIPNVFVCDGLTAWAYTHATGEVNAASGQNDIGPADYQWDMIKKRNGIKTNLSDMQPGDLIFWGADDTLTKYPGALSDAGWPGHHAAIYYHDGQMIHSSTMTGHNGVGIDAAANYPVFNFLGGGSPYPAETSRVPLPD